MNVFRASGSSGQCFCEKKRAENRPSYGYLAVQCRRTQVQAVFFLKLLEDSRSSASRGRDQHGLALYSPRVCLRDFGVAGFGGLRRGIRHTAEFLRIRLLSVFPHTGDHTKPACNLDARATGNSVHPAALNLIKYSHGTNCHHW